MIPEKLGIPNISAQRLDAFVSAYVHHFEDGGASLGRGRQKPSTKRVPAEFLRLQSHAAGASLDDLGNGPIGQAAAQDTAGLADRPEEGAADYSGLFEPVTGSRDRAGERAGHNSDGRAFALLVGFASTNCDPQAVLAELEIADIERYEFGAAKSPRETKQGASETDIARVDRWAGERGLSRSQAIRALIEEGLKK